MGKLGKVTLTITDENRGGSVDATSYPMEKGSPVTDHVQERPDTLDITGVLVGNTTGSQISYLRGCMKKGAVLNYVGRVSAKNVIILDIQENRSASIKNGAGVSISLQYVRFADVAWRKKKPAQKKTSNTGKKQPVSKKKTTNTAKYHVVKRGETYSHIAVKYKVSLSKILSWNKWEPTRLPVGAKVRVA
jgi:LysM repeat protein